MSHKPERPEIVRDAWQLQRAHDVLALIVHSEELQDALLEGDPLREATVKSMVSSLDLLCWLLGHDNDTFAANMIKVEAALKALGGEIYDAGRLVWPGEGGDGPLPS